MKAFKADNKIDIQDKSIFSKDVKNVLTFPIDASFFAKMYGDTENIRLQLIIKKEGISLSRFDTMAIMRYAELDLEDDMIPLTMGHLNHSAIMRMIEIGHNKSFFTEEELEMAKREELEAKSGSNKKATVTFEEKKAAFTKPKADAKKTEAKADVKKDKTEAKNVKVEVMPDVKPTTAPVKDAAKDDIIDAVIVTPVVEALPAPEVKADAKKDNKKKQQPHASRVNNTLGGVVNLASFEKCRKIRMDKNSNEKANVIERLSKFFTDAFKDAGFVDAAKGLTFDCVKTSYNYWGNFIMVSSDGKIALFVKRNTVDMFTGEKALELARAEQKKMKEANEAKAKTKQNGGKKHTA